MNDRYQREVEIVRNLTSNNNIHKFIDNHNELYKSHSHTDQEKLKGGTTRVALSCFHLCFIHLEKLEGFADTKYIKTSVKNLAKLLLLSEKNLKVHLRKLIEAGFFNIETHELKNEFILEFHPSLISTIKINYDIRYPEKLKDYRTLIENQ